MHLVQCIVLYNELRLFITLDAEVAGISEEQFHMPQNILKPKTESLFDYGWGKWISKRSKF